MFHHQSVFGTGKRRALDRDQRARFRFLLSAHRRARRISPLSEHVGVALLRRLSVDGRCDPSHETLAADVGCSERTVRRACGAMRGLGLLRWQTRLVRSGWRVEQTSNAYELVPDGAPPTGGQVGRETRKIRFISLADEDRAARENRDRLLAVMAGWAQEH